MASQWRRRIQHFSRARTSWLAGAAPTARSRCARCPGKSAQLLSRSMITVAVSDSEYTTTEEFSVTVTPVGELPEQFAIFSPRDGDVLRARAAADHGLSAAGTVPRTTPSNRSARHLPGRKERIRHGGRAPYSLVWSNPPPGAFTLLAYTTNRSGLITSPPVNVTFTTNAPPGQCFVPRAANWPSSGRTPHWSSSWNRPPRWAATPNGGRWKRRLKPEMASGFSCRSPRTNARSSG